MKTCTRCGDEIGILSGRTNLKDGMLCSKCKTYLMEIGAEDLIEISEKIKYEKLVSIIEHKKELSEKFDEDISVGELLKIDFKNKILKFDDSLMDFSNVAKVETQEHWEQKTSTSSTAKKKGGLTRGLVGGFLFGGVGALVGAATAKTKTKNSSTEASVCSYVTLTVVLKDYYRPHIVIDLNPTNKELNLAQCVSVETYAAAIKRAFEKVIENAE